MQKSISFTRINNDTNGNPRYVCHFLNLLTDKDEADIKNDFAACVAQNPFKIMDFKYELALERARKIGGKKFHNKQYGGGVAFQSYNIADTERRILELINAGN